MPMSPREFFKEIARPNLEELDAHFDDRRRAFNAVTSVDALAAHLFEWCLVNCPAEVNGLKDDIEYREHLARRNPDFRLLRDMAKAVKHVKVRRSSNSLVGSAGAAIDVASFGWGEARRGEARWDSPPQVVATTKDGDKHAVDALAKRVAQFLEQEMNRLGVP